MVVGHFQGIKLRSPVRAFWNRPWRLLAICLGITLALFASQVQAGPTCSEIFKDATSSKQEILDLLRHLNPQRSQKKSVQKEITIYRSFLAWSLERDPLLFSVPEFSNKIRVMARSLNRAMVEANRQSNREWMEQFEFIHQTQKRLNELAQKDRVTYGELALLADDFTLASSLVNGWRPGNWLLSSPEFALRNSRRNIQNVLTLAPYVMVRHIGNESLHDFVDQLFLPILKLGITDRLMSYDGAVEIVRQGDQFIFVPSFRGPRSFYEHDLSNHGFKALDSRLFEMNDDYTFKLSEARPSLLEHIQKILRQFEFHLQIESFKRTRSSVEAEALNAILFVVYHEFPDEIFGRTSSFTRTSLRQALQSSFRDNQLPIQEFLGKEIVERLYKDNDLGADLPGLRALAPHEAEAVIRRMADALAAL